MKTSHMLVALVLIGGLATTWILGSESSTNISLKKWQTSQRLGVGLGKE